MTSTLRTPTYPSWDGRTIDLATEPVLAVTNNADYPLLLRFDWQDLDDPSKEFTQTRRTSAVRGEEILTNVSGGSFEDGHDYACTPILYGREPNAVEDSLSPGRYDVLMGSGRTQTDSQEADKIYIDRDITCIRLPIRDGDTLLGGCAIRLGEETYLIEYYNASTGECTVSSAEINGAVSYLRTTGSGERYSLISNYVVGQPFTFKLRSQPVCTLNYEIKDGMLHITGEYSQAQGVPIQSYRMYADYYYDIPTTIEHERVYGTTIVDDFPIAPKDSLNMCTVYCEITTLDDCVKTFTLPVPAMVSGEIEIERTVGSSVQMIGKPEGATVHFWREERDDPEGLELENYQRIKHIGTTTSSHFTDYTTGNQRTYRYSAAVVTEDGTVLASGFTGQYNVYDRTCSIQQLERVGYHRYKLVPNKMFTFSCDLDSGSISTVTGNAVYRSSAKTPKFIRGSDAYDTGALTAILGSVTSPEATPSDIKRWRNMMTSDGIFLLKTDYGDVKIIAITGDPSRQCGSSLEELGITRVTIAWTEIDDIEQAVIE